MKADVNYGGIAAALMITLLCMFAAPLIAAEQALPDVRIVIDISGSMKDNDPNNLRGPALELLVQQLPDGAKAGVWTFGQWVNMLVKHRQIDDQWRQQAIAAIDQITTLGLYTNIPQALETATYDIDHLKPEYQTSLIVLTDGRVELSDSSEENAKARAGILDNLLPKLADAGIAVHTVALSAQADNTLLQTLARETNGLAARADSAEQLNRVFLQALDAAAPKPQVPLSGNLFLIDASVDEFTLLVFKAAGAPQTALVSPVGESYDVSTDSERIRWYSSDSYDLITVASPAAGEWSLFAEEHADNRVTVVSNLALEVDRIAKNQGMGKGRKLRVRFLEKGAVINDRAFLGLIDVSATLFSADDRQWDIPAKSADVNGEYQLNLPELNSSGDYELVISVDGKTFKRVDTQMFAVVEAMPVNTSKERPATTEARDFSGWLWGLLAGLLMLIIGVWLYYLGYFNREEDYDEAYDDEYEDDFDEFSAGDEVNTNEDWDDIPILTEPAEEFEPAVGDEVETLAGSDYIGAEDGNFELPELEYDEPEGDSSQASDSLEFDEGRDDDIADQDFSEDQAVTKKFSDEEPDWDDAVADEDQKDDEGNDRR